jgi:alpha-beta hydrolase superfamily lysophospholipase
MKLNAVIHQLQPLDMQCPASGGPAIEAYYQHYHLDIAATCPGVSQYIGTFESGRYEVAGQLFLRENARGTVFLVHGYTDHLGLYGALIRHLLGMGYSVAGFDLPGHGLSSGELASITSFSHYDRALEDYMGLCAGHLPEPWYVIGHSTGAAAVMSLMLRDPAHAFKKAVLLAPLVRPHNWAWLKWVHWSLGRFVRHWPRKFGSNSHDHGFMEFIARHDPLQTQSLKVEWISSMNNWIKWFLALPPSASEVLVVQGEGDETVDWRYNLEIIHEKFPHAEVLRLPLAKHHLVRESSEFRGKVFQALANFF